MMDTKRIATAFKIFANQIKSIILALMEERGVNEKINKNTLINSHIWNDLRTENNSFDLIEFFINDYVQFIESGRRPGAKFPPPMAIANWCKDKGLPSDNRTVYLICRAIARDGIKPRPFLDDAFEELDKYWDDWSDSLFQLLTETLDEYFSD